MRLTGSRLFIPCYMSVYFSHRPVDVYNVYNQVQVKMLMKEDDCENIPAFEDVFRDDEDEQEEEEEASFDDISVKSVCFCPANS